MSQMTGREKDAASVYAAAHTVIQTELQKELQEVTVTQAPMARMMADPETLTFGENFIRTFNVKRVLDVGTFTGVSALAWALAVPEDRVIFTFDIDMSNYEKFGVPVISKSAETFKKITTIEGPALDSLDDLIAGGQSGTFDFAFIDADKEGYCDYYDRVVTLLRSGGIIFVDNCRLTGSMTNPEEFKKDSFTAAIHAANQKIFHDPRTRSALLTLGAGTHIAFKI